jgi:LPS sulfotransferase NodH
MARGGSNKTVRAIGQPWTKTCLSGLLTKPCFWLFWPLIGTGKCGPKNMGPFEYIEKWISEHGSATVLREHVAMLKSQIGELESKAAISKAALEACQAEKQQFEAKAAELQVQLQDAHAEIQRLNSGDAPRFLGFLQPPDRPGG